MKIKISADRAVEIMDFIKNHGAELSKHQTGKLFD